MALAPVRERRALVCCGGPGAATVSPGQGVCIPQARARGGWVGVGVAPLLPAAPGERRGSAQLTAGLDVTLKYYNHQQCCTSLNYSFLMPVTNLRCHHVATATSGTRFPQTPVGRSHCPWHGGTPAPPHIPHPPSKHNYHAQGKSSPGAAPWLQKPPPGRRFWQQVHVPGAAAASPWHCPDR